MNLAYLFTFFVLVLLALFVLLPFLQHEKSTLETSATANADDEVIELDDDIDHDDAVPAAINTDVVGNAPLVADDYDIEIEVAVSRMRRLKSTFWVCSCGRQMGDIDRFCAACGKARQ